MFSTRNQRRPELFEEEKQKLVIKMQSAHVKEYL